MSILPVSPFTRFHVLAPPWMSVEYTARTVFVGPRDEFRKCPPAMARFPQIPRDGQTKLEDEQVLKQRTPSWTKDPELGVYRNHVTSYRKLSTFSISRAPTMSSVAGSRPMEGWNSSTLGGCAKYTPAQAAGSVKSP